jgi:SAM-dependent methyltransferase
VKVCPACGREFQGVAWRCPACLWQPEWHHDIALLGAVPPRDGEGFTASSFAWLAKREAEHFWHVGRSRLLLWALRRFARDARSFLEIGCGTGFVLQSLAERHPGLALTGAELFLEGLEFASRRVPRAAFLQLDARRLPFKDEFDCIGLFDVLEHITEDQQVLDSVAKACRPGGTVLVTVPQHPWLWTILDEHSCHVRRYTRRDLAGKLRRAGLRPVRSTSFVSLLLPVLFLSRAWMQLRKDRFDPAREFDLAPWKQKILLKCMDLERCLIRAGLPLPAGGSLLVVARKPQR